MVLYGLSHTPAVLCSMPYLNQSCSVQYIPPNCEPCHVLPQPYLLCCPQCMHSLIVKENHQSSHVWSSHVLSNQPSCVPCPTLPRLFVCYVLLEIVLKYTMSYQTSCAVCFALPYRGLLCTIFTMPSIFCTICISYLLSLLCALPHSAQAGLAQ